MIKNFERIGLEALFMQLSNLYKTLKKVNYHILVAIT